MTKEKKELPKHRRKRCFQKTGCTLIASSIAFVVFVIACFFTLYWVLLIVYPIQETAITWDWSSFNAVSSVHNLTSTASISKDFLWGVSSAAYELEGNNTFDNNNWFLFERRSNSTFSSDFWSTYQTDIQKMSEELHLNSFRLSVEWSRIEPSEGVYDEAAMQRYHDIIDTLLLYNITPMVTLHHFTEPIWFYKKSSFEVAANAQYFVNFSKYVFSKLSDKVRHWCTINEPNTYVINGYLFGTFPPGKNSDFETAATVFNNLLQAHVAVYQELKKMPNGESASIGIIYRISQYDPYQSTNSLDRYSSTTFSNQFTFSIVQFFTKGSFTFLQHLPKRIEQTIKNELAPSSLDFFGLSYFSRSFVSFRLNFTFPYTMKTDPYAVAGDDGKEVYAEGLYRALKLISSINASLPIYVAANGIADAADATRETYITKHIYAMITAMKEQVNVKGYYYWGLKDGYEFENGLNAKYGLYSSTMVPRNSTSVFVDVVKKARN